MTEVLQSPTHTHFPSPQSSSPNNDPHQHSLISSVTEEGRSESIEEERERVRREREREQLSLLAFLVGACRKSLIGCSNIQNKELGSMEIGWPSNVRHVAHVTFDRFNGFLGLPVEFEPEVPRRAPSASANVFGVSTQSMQLSFDSRGNSVPTILLLMQRHLYARGGLQAEGIFRINAENSQEEYVRERLNMGLVPDNVDVHCLAGLIKAWFRELPTGVLDSLSPEQVMQSQSEEECVQLVRLLPPTEAALLDWAVNLMADVAQLEHMNKMNARNIAMVFAPNMTQMADPLTALMYAVQVMNFLKTLIIKTLRDREDSVLDTAPALRLDPTDENGHDASAEPMLEEPCGNGEAHQVFVAKEPPVSPTHSSQDESKTENDPQSFLANVENVVPGENINLVDNCPCEVVSQVSSISSEHKQAKPPLSKSRSGQTSHCHLKKNSKKISQRLAIHAAAVPPEKGKGTVIVSRINARKELVEVWR